MRAMAWMAAASMLWSGGPAYGHEGGVDVRGVVVSADSAQVSVRGPDGKDRSFALTPQTRVVVDGRAAKPAELVPGQRAVVHGRMSGGRLEAQAVRAAAPKGAPAR